MASLKKNFSIAQLYSDLEKYEANLAGPKDSRLRKQASGPSLPQRPSSTNHKNYESRQSFGSSHLQAFSKAKLEVAPKVRRSRPTFDNYDQEEPRSYNYSRNLYREGAGSHNTSVLRENYLENLPGKENRPAAMEFKKSDEHYFLTECNKLYNLKQEDKRSLTVQEQENSVKLLLNQINKRDRVYDCVTSKLGAEKIEQKLISFFQGYDRMVKIVAEFKKMSKLDIESDHELYQFLVSEEPEKEETGAREKGEQN